MSTARLHSASSTSVAAIATDRRPPQISQTFDVRLEGSRADVDVNPGSGDPKSDVQLGNMATSSDPVRLSDLEIAAWCANRSLEQQAGTADSPPDALGADSVSGGQADETDGSVEQADRRSHAEPSLLPPRVELSRGRARLLTVARRYPVGALAAAILGALVVVAFGVATMRIATTMVQPTKTLHESALQ